MFHIQLPLAGIEVWWPGLVILGLAIGFLTGMFGVGGGFLLTPCLNILFGIPYPVAVGSDLAQIFITGTVSAWKHWQNRNVDIIMGIVMALGALCGTEVGVHLLNLIGTGGEIIFNGRAFTVINVLMPTLFLVLMTGVAYSIWRETSDANGKDEIATAIAQNLQSHKISPLMAFKRSGIPSLCLWIPLLLSFSVGILTGFLGVGGGFINFPLLVYVLGVPTVVAIGTSAFQILFATGYGALRHAGLGHVELSLVGILLAGSLIGVQLGVHVSRLVGGLKIRRYFAWVITLGIVVILWDLARKVWF